MKKTETPEIRIAGVSDSQIIALRKRSNELTGLGKLPEEIIVLLFELVQRSGNIHEWARKHDMFYRIFGTPCEDPWGHYGKLSSVGWVRLMSVCARLRDIALKTSKLWQFEGIMIPGNERWTEICVKRALPGQQLPILRYSSWFAREYADELQSEDYHLDFAIPALARHLPNVAEAYIVLPFVDEYYEEQDVERISTQCLGQSCTHIKFLSITATSCDFHISLPAGLLNGASDTLTTLTCTNLDHDEGPWANFHFPGLRNLKLTFWYDPGPYLGIYDADPLITFLKKTPRLEIFFFQCHWFEITPHRTTISKEDLPHLRIIHIDCSIQGAQPLLAILPKPSVGVDIVIQSHIVSEETESQHETNWEDPEVKLAFEHVITFVSNFWETIPKPRRTGELVPTLLFQSSPPRIIKRRIHFSSHTPWRWIDVSKPQPFCKLDVPFFGDKTPFYNVTKAIQFDWATHPLLDPESPHSKDLPALIGLTTIIVKELEIPGLILLDTWMRRREAGGQAVKLLQIYQSQREEVETYLREMTRNLLKDGVVGHVEWVRVE